jgi:hypothetical protein
VSCFIAPYGGRPSPAVQLTRGGDIALVSPRAQDLGHGRVASGVPNVTGDNLFAIGTELIALTGEECADPILFDFGPGSDSYFVYTRGRAPAKASRRG